MPHAVTDRIQIRSLDDDVRQDSELGAEVILPSTSQLFDPASLTPEETDILRHALFDHGVLVIRNQTGLSPTVLPQLAHIFDPTVKDIHSGGEKQVTDPKNILSQNGCARVPSAPQVTVIGQGIVEGHEDIPRIELKHLDHTAFHKSPLTTAEIEERQTRPYRWHMDAPLYEHLPGFVTSLLCHDVPDLPDQFIRFADGSEKSIAAGATAFFSGARNFDLLSPEQKVFALNTTVHYAPRAYEWMKDCKATSDGLTIASQGREVPIEKLPPFEASKVHSFPMVWRNASNGRPHLQILGCCVKSLETHDASTGKTTLTQDLDEVRRICHELQSRIYAADKIYAHRWQKGDVVMFHNRGVMHSITGQLSKNADRRRLLWQCSMASGTAPEAFAA